ncbi:MAG: hypothetical protein QOF60_646 [Actinomycetota bacterium]|jgi:hypothetical protein|nr:hypothetical protein [Actinomycetota bacterium]
MDDRDLAKYYAAGRVGIGLLMLLVPGRMLSGMVGRDAARTPAVKLLGRLLGVRDAIIGAGSLAVLNRGAEGYAAEVRPWMSYGAVADAGDALFMLFAYRHLPKRKRFGVLLLALSGAGTGGYLVTKFD